MQVSQRDVLHSNIVVIYRQRLMIDLISCKVVTSIHNNTVDSPRHDTVYRTLIVVQLAR